MKTNNFEDLVVWQQAYEFVLKIYTTTLLFPKEELFGLTSQFKRASVSIAANIAEGYKRSGIKDKLRFYNTSEVSINEYLYYIILSNDLHYIDQQKHDELYQAASSVSKLLNAYCNGIINNTNNQA
ncbi:four helix bundle protein [Microbacter margulisiae]|uniref:Four helix bundle protein n=1 Tax=Microbacter margulisiae TaxID=1350067 RepID=A0A7W5DP48_9PORP|nr:four helix bundle protein [Microbacter margulisiae]MBB3186522.1 four helix bundle protein [Microbacter margulisiae]